MDEERRFGRKERNITTRKLVKECWNDAKLNKNTNPELEEGGANGKSE